MNPAGKQPLSLLESLEPRRLFNIYTVTISADAGAGSFRQAMIDANTHLGSDTIRFAIGSGPQTISPLSAFPDLSDPVTIDATTQPGYVGQPMVELSGARISAPSVPGLRVLAGNSTIKGLVINRFSGTGIIVAVGNNNTIQNNYIGLDLTGTLARPNTFNGVELDTDTNALGGSLASQRNVISGNGGLGVLVFLTGSGNSIRGNYIGLNAGGNAAVPNTTSGIDLQGGDANTVGGTGPGDGNVISGNLEDGIVVLPVSSYNVIQQNRIGTDATGTFAIGNGAWGVEIQSSHNLLGGLTASARNILSGNGQTGAVMYLASSQYNTVQGNYVGTDIAGTRAIPNAFSGIAITADFGARSGPTHNTIGGRTPEARNVISGNNAEGVGLFNAAKLNTVSGNYIGTQPDGMTPLPNHGGGVSVFNGSTGNIIGGENPGTGNLISGNLKSGVTLGAESNFVQGNIIGLNFTGGAPLPNSEDGIVILNSFNTIGRFGYIAARNIISGNAGRGVFIIGPGGSNTIGYNFIGTDGSGAKPQPNGSVGIWTVNSSSGNSILSNTIAFNPVGVRVGDGVGQRMTGNSIFSNTQIGIDLGYDGVTPNDPGDADTGPNNLQNYPVITSTSGGKFTGILDCAPNTNYKIDIFWSAEISPGNFGQKILTTLSSFSPATGLLKFGFQRNDYIPSGYITMTATDPAGNTSELSPPISYTRDFGSPWILSGKNVYLKVDGTGVNLDAWIDSPTPGVGAPDQVMLIPAISTVIVNGSTGNDLLTIDESSGGGGIPLIFNGSTAGTNTLAVIGSYDNDVLTASENSVNLASSQISFLPRSFSLSHVQSLQFEGGIGDNDLINLSGGSYVIDADTASGSPQVSVSVNSGAIATFATDQHLANLILNGGTANLSTTRHSMYLNGLSITSNGLLDIANSFLYLNNSTTSFTTAKTYLDAAYNLHGSANPNAPFAGDYNGLTGITSSIAKASYANDVVIGIGCYDGALQDPANPDNVGQRLGPNSDSGNGSGIPLNQILIRPTLTGDLNGDGVVNAYDISVFNSFGLFNSGPTPLGWQAGDLNGDGAVDSKDVTVFNTVGNLNAGAFPPPPVIPAIAHASVQAIRSKSMGVSSPKTRRVLQHFDRKANHEVRIRHRRSVKIPFAR